MRLVSLAARSSLRFAVFRAVSSAGTLLRPICASCGASRARRSAGCKLLSLLNRRARTVLKLSIRPTGCCERRHRHRATLLRETLPCLLCSNTTALHQQHTRADARALSDRDKKRIETRNSTPLHKMPRRRKPTTSSGSAGSQRRRSFQSDSSDDWEDEPTRGEVYRDRFLSILRFLWDTTKLTMVWLSFVWLAAHLFDEWSLRDARRAIDVAEALAANSDLNGARDAYGVALGHLQRAEVREPFAASALAAGGRLFRLPVLFLLRNPWPAVEARLIALAATIRELASVPEPGENWERR